MVPGWGHTWLQDGHGATGWEWQATLRNAGLHAGTRRTGWTQGYRQAGLQQGRDLAVGEPLVECDGVRFHLEPEGSGGVAAEDGAHAHLAAEQLLTCRVLPGVACRSKLGGCDLERRPDGEPLAVLCLRERRRVHLRHRAVVVLNQRKVLPHHLDTSDAQPRHLRAWSLALLAARSSAGALAHAQLQRVGVQEQHEEQHRTSTHAHAWRSRPWMGVGRSTRRKLAASREGGSWRGIWKG